MRTDDNWTPRAKLTRRFWVGCAVFLFSISLLIATIITTAQTPDASLPWGQIIVVVLVAAAGARLALSNGNLAAIKARFK